MKRIILDVIILVIIFAHPGFSQISYHLDLESGYYRSKNSITETQSRWGFNADGKLKYTYKSNSRIASINIRARPEFYNTESEFYTIKLRAAGNYLQRGEKVDWGINVIAQKFNFDISNSGYSNNSILFNGELSTFISDETLLRIRAGYSTRNVSTNSKLTLDLVSADVLLYEDIASFQIGYGIYLEKYNTYNSVNEVFNSLYSSIKGFRIGPKISLNYVRDFIVKLKYEILFHNSDITEPTSYEHQVYLVAGKLLTSKLSAFFFLNYYLSKLKYAEDYNESSLIYIPADIDNTAFLKIAYDLKENLELYIKSGYRKIELLQNSSALNGWSIILGLSFSK
jgi:hypothetical protein